MLIAPRIQADPGKCGGKPCVRDTRVRVVDVLQMLAGGASPTEILEDFPYLEAADIPAVLSYAAHVTARPVVFPMDEEMAAAAFAAE